VKFGYDIKIKLNDRIFKYSFDIASFIAGKIYLLSLT